MARVDPVLVTTGVIRLSGMFPPSSDLPALQRKQGKNLAYQTPHLTAAFKEYGVLPRVYKAGAQHGGAQRQTACRGERLQSRGSMMAALGSMPSTASRPHRPSRASLLTYRLTAPAVSSRDRMARSSPTSYTPNRPARRSPRWSKPCTPASRWWSSRFTRGGTESIWRVKARRRIRP